MQLQYYRSLLTETLLYYKYIGRCTGILANLSSQFVHVCMCSCHAFIPTYSISTGAPGTTWHFVGTVLTVWLTKLSKLHTQKDTGLHFKRCFKIITMTEICTYVHVSTHDRKLHSFVSKQIMQLAIYAMCFYAQVDLIDMRHLPDGSYHWILHCVDHWSKFNFAYPLASKHAVCVSAALNTTFSPTQVCLEFCTLTMDASSSTE